VKLYLWAALSAVMALVILATSFGARPGFMQLIFLLILGVVLAGVSIQLIFWGDESRLVELDDEY
jgi:hypothetical protein